jgi:hypothetical protein
MIAREYKVLKKAIAKEIPKGIPVEYVSCRTDNEAQREIGTIWRNRWLSERIKKINEKV